MTREPLAPIDLDALLKEDAHVDDAGFTDRVIARLPPKRRRVGKREAVLVASAVAAGGAGFAWLQGVDVAATISGLGATWLGIAAGALLLSLALWGALAEM